MYSKNIELAIVSHDATWRGSFGHVFRRGVARDGAKHPCSFALDVAVSIDSFCYSGLMVLCDFDNDPAIREATSPPGALLILYVSCYEFIDFVYVCTTCALVRYWCPAEVL